MSNSIARRRRRPRVKSVSFLSLWWLIAREAAWSTLDAGVPLSRQSRFGIFIMRAPLAQLRLLCGFGRVSVVDKGKP